MASPPRLPQVVVSSSTFLILFVWGGTTTPQKQSMWPCQVWHHLQLTPQQQHWPVQQSYAAHASQPKLAAPEMQEPNRTYDRHIILCTSVIVAFHGLQMRDFGNTDYQRFPWRNLSFEFWLCTVCQITDDNYGPVSTLWMTECIIRCW